MRVRLRRPKDFKMDFPMLVLRLISFGGFSMRSVFSSRNTPVVGSFAARAPRICRNLLRYSRMHIIMFSLIFSNLGVDTYGSIPVSSSAVEEGWTSAVRMI